MAISKKQSMIQQRWKVQKINPDDLIFLDEAIELTGYKRQSFYNMFCKRRIRKFGSRRNLKVSKKEVIEKLLLNAV